MPLQGIEIVADRLLDQQPNVRYVRLQVVDVSITIQEIYQSISNVSWISRLSIHNALKRSFAVRAKRTADAVKTQFSEDITQVEAKTGEYVVSESARRYLVDALHYSDIPLGEVIKQKRIGNPGYDFFSENMQNILLFGEAKYRGDETGYREAINQAKKFRDEKSDEADLLDIANFVSEESLDRYEVGQKGFVAAFTTWDETDEQVAKRIVKIYEDVIKK